MLAVMPDATFVRVSAELLAFDATQSRGGRRDAVQISLFQSQDTGAHRLIATTDGCVHTMMQDRQSAAIIIGR